jgi:hypothetical protein
MKVLFFAVFLSDLLLHLLPNIFFSASFSNTLCFYVGVEVLIGVAMKITVFWDITRCSPLKVNQRFRGTYRFHLQGRKIS